jgi:sigma-B regulation protein RsbU (phosphoserine phosphatase)
MSRFTQVRHRLGISGIAFTIFLALFLLFYLTGNSGMTVVSLVFLIPLSAIVLFRLLRWIQVHALWSVRNRLLFVYWLMAILPLFLILLLVGLGAWAFTTELAVYLATSALERRVDSINNAIQVLEGMTTAQRTTAASDFQKGMSHDFPNFRLYIKDDSGERKYPSDASDLKLPKGWGTTNGLLFLDHRFYGWAHVRGPHGDITGLAPLSDSMVGGLVPNLGSIRLFERDHSGENAGREVQPLEPEKGEPERQGFHLPPAMNRFDVPLLWAANVNHSHLDSPNQTFDAILSINSRPSAVFSTVFGKAESLRGVLFQVFIAIAILFLIVEVVAIIIGVRLSGRLTHAVNQLYEGTRRVIHGDFRHRILSSQKDQLGELAESFNQMTSNLERLFAVEKEKERLQTELEIAREVQNQLYPKHTPPMRGLQLSAVCDPARMVSGDYYDYTEVGRHQLAFAVGDVAGKGISAALLMATLQAALRSQVANSEATHVFLDSASVISQLNKQIYATTSAEKYATFFFAVFDQPSQKLTYTNAGHLSPLLLRRGEFTALDSNGTVVGAFPFAKYDSSSIVMQPDDLLVCYTDGITEPENPYGEMFGEDRLMELVKKHSHQDDGEILRIVFDAVRSWTGTAELFDDMTLLLARGVQLT